MSATDDAAPGSPRLSEVWVDPSTWERAAPGWDHDPGERVVVGFDVGGAVVTGTAGGSLRFVWPVDVCQRVPLEARLGDDGVWTTEGGRGGS